MTQDRDMLEIWAPIPIAPGYEASTLGRVRSRRGVLRSRITTSGYPQINVSIHGVRRTATVHSLVASAFLGPRPAGLETCHNDGCRSNNLVGNLRYDTRVGNDSDKRHHGTLLVGERNGNSKLTPAQVQEIRRRVSAGESQRRCANAFGVSRALISYIARQINWAHLSATGGAP